MRSALAAEQASADKLVHAQVLREMTITKEELFTRQKDSVLDALMSSMTRIAADQGGSNYVAQLTPQFDPTLLAEITKTLEGLGYKVTSEARNQKDIGSYVALTISWAAEQ